MGESEIFIERIGNLMKTLVKTLEVEGIEYFNGKPALEIAHKGKYLMISLIDDDLKDITCKLNQNPRKGKKYIFINKNELINNSLDEVSFIYLQVKAIKEESEENTAYYINIERVNKLIKDGDYAVALVFIISAFEVVLSDLFFRYHELWFADKISKFQEYDDDLYLEYGKVMKNARDKRDYPIKKIINGQTWGIHLGRSEKYQKWKELKLREYIYDCCKKLNILDEYASQLRSNKFSEIGTFEILKKVLRKPRSVFQSINFQSLHEKNGVKKAFNLFFNIDFGELREEIAFFDEIIKKRHRIIHGKLLDSEIEKQETEKAVNTLKRIKDYISNMLSQQIYKYPRNMYFIF